MKITVEATPAEMQEMGADTPDELKQMLLEQLNEGALGRDGEVGEDWIAPFSLEIVIQ